MNNFTQVSDVAETQTGLILDTSQKYYFLSQLAQSWQLQHITVHHTDVYTNKYDADNNNFPLEFRHILC